MLSKNKIKYIQSLARKKQRDIENAFLVEGDKMVAEALNSGLPVKLVCGTEPFLNSHKASIKLATEVIEVEQDELRKVSLLQAPQNALAVICMPKTELRHEELSEKLSLALDFIQDPGNLGTIIRIADWFGIENVLCSSNTVDCYNPKVIQASMGAIFRVRVHYINLPETLSALRSAGTPVYGTFLEGENIYMENLKPNGIIVMGNEGNGISPEVATSVTNKIHIPSFNTSGSGSESLNVSTAAAICCAEFRRRQV